MKSEMKLDLASENKTSLPVGFDAHRGSDDGDKLAHKKGMSVI